MLNPYAYFDSLFIGKKLQERLGNFSAAEIHLFSYLSCLLSLYKKQPATDWYYWFAGTKQGAPYSIEVAESISELQLRGFFIPENNFLKVTDKGIEEYSFLHTLSQNSQRETYLEGACSSILALPIGIIREALFNEPELKNASTLSSTRKLLNGPELDWLYDHFSALSNIIGVDVQDLMVPAVVWLSFLANISQPITIQNDDSTMETKYEL